MMLSNKLKERAQTDCFLMDMLAQYKQSGSSNKQHYIDKYHKAISEAETSLKPLGDSSLRKMMDFYTDPFAKMEKVYGKSASKNARRSIKGKYEIEELNQRAEIDAMYAPIALQHPLRDASIGMPLEYMYMNVGSRGIAGHMMSVGMNQKERTSYYIALIQQALLPKHHLQHKYGTEHLNPFYGAHDLIGHDAASALTSRAMMQFWLLHQLSINTGESGKPQGRGFLERFHLTYATCFLQQLPGFLPKIKEYAQGKRSMKEMAVLNLCEYKVLSERYRNDTYHHREHSGLYGKTPVEVYETIPAFKRFSLPVNPHKLQDYYAPTGQKATLTKDRGFQFEGRFYHHPEITTALYHELKQTRKSTQVEVYVNVNDLSKVKIGTKKNDTLLDVPFNRYAPKVDPDDRFDLGISTFLDEEFDRLRPMDSQEIIEEARRRKHGYKRKQKEKLTKAQPPGIDLGKLQERHLELAFTSSYVDSGLSNKEEQELSNGGANPAGVNQGDSSELGEDLPDSGVSVG